MPLLPNPLLLLQEPLLLRRCCPSCLLVLAWRVNLQLQAPPNRRWLWQQALVRPNYCLLQAVL